MSKPRHPESVKLGVGSAIKTFHLQVTDPGYVLTVFPSALQVHMLMLDARRVLMQAGEKDPFELVESELSKLLWDAREHLEMAADLINGRPRSATDPWQSLVDRIDAYRAAQGWSVDGFGGESDGRSPRGDLHGVVSGNERGSVRTPASGVPDADGRGGKA